MTPIRTVTTPVFTKKPPNPVTPPTSLRVDEVTETNGANGSNGSEPSSTTTPTPPLAPRSPSPVAGSRNMVACALVTGVDRDGRCPVCRAPVLRSGRSMAARACAVYGREAAA